jgi:hypothetical protein
MKRFILLFGVLGVCSTVNGLWAQGTKQGPKKDTVLIQKGKETFVQIKFDNGKMAEEGIWINQQKQGVWNTFHDNGFPESVTAYESGKKNGIEMKLGKDGYLEQMCYYTNDVLHGPFRLYFKGARIQKEQNFVNGLEDGKRQIYFKDGGIQEEGIWKNGKRECFTTNKRLSFKPGNIPRAFKAESGKSITIRGFYRPKGSMFKGRNQGNGKFLTPKENYKRRSFTKAASLKNK